MTSREISAVDACAAFSTGCAGIICGQIHHDAAIRDMIGQLTLLRWIDYREAAVVPFASHPSPAMDTVPATARISASSALAPIRNLAGVAQAEPSISSASEK